MVQWINLHQNNNFVNIQWLPLLNEKSGVVVVIVRWLSTKMWTRLTKAPNFLRFKFLIGAAPSMLPRKPSKYPRYLLCRHFIKSTITNLWNLWRYRMIKYLIQNWTNVDNKIKENATMDMLHITAYGHC